MDLCSYIQTTLIVMTVFLIARNNDCMCSEPQTVGKIEENAVSEFMAKLVSISTPICDIIVLQDQFDHGITVDKILTMTLRGTYIVKFKHKSTPTFSFDLLNIHRLSKQCTLAIILVNKPNSTLFKEMREAILATFIPIIRKDEDYHVFLTHPKYHRKLLLNVEYPSRIKFKVCVGQRDDGNLAVTTVNFVGRNKARPLVKKLSTTKFHDYFPDFLRDLNGKVLRVTVPYSRGLIETYENPHELKNGKRGHWKYLLEEYLMVKFNFTYHMFPSTGTDGKAGGGGSGVQLSNGTWIGCIGDLYYGRADIGLAVANTDKRIQFIGFTDTFYDTACLTFTTRQPTRIYSLLALFWPFNMNLWNFIIISAVISIVFIYFMLKLVVQHVESSPWPISYQIYVLLMPFVEQACSTIPPITPLRCFLAMWSFYVLIVTNLYQSKLVTLLAFPILGKLPETFEELAFSGYNVGFIKHGDSAYNTLAASKDPVYVKLLQEMEIITGFGLECLEKVVKQENYACIGYDFAFVHLLHRNLSDADARQLVTSNSRTYNIWMGLATEAKSIYRMNFGKVLSYTRPFHLPSILWDKMDMHDNVRRLKLKWWAEANQTQLLSVQFTLDSSILTLKHIKGAFFVLIFSSAFCFIAFVCELLINDLS